MTNTRTYLLAALLLSACGEEATTPHEPRDLAVRIDVLPGAWPNTTSFDAPAAIDVAILGSAELDATAVDGASLVAWSYDRSRTVAVATELRFEDVDGDGRDDAIAAIELDALLTAGVIGPKATRLVLAGETVDGDRLEGWDLVLDAARPTLELPAVTGPYAVGVVDYAWTDDARTNEVGPAAGDPRRIKVQVWYPADVVPGAQPTQAWRSLAESAAMVDWFFLTYLGIDLPTELYEYVSVPAVLDAPLHTGAGPLPVLVFSHGLGISPPAHSALLAELASHGFVVAAVYHAYFTGPMELPDGTLIIGVAEEASMDDLLRIKVADLQFVLAQLDALAADDARFAGHLDMERVGVIGMSSGGFAATQACIDQPRFLAGVNLDGPIPDAALDNGIDQAFMLVNTVSAPDRMVLGDPRPAFLDSVRGDAFSLTLPDAGHINLTDFGLHESLIRSYQPGAVLPDLGSIDPELAIEIVNAYVAAFFATYVAGESEALLDQPSPWAEAELVRWE